jgi:diguanylate cyclase (GGDEF)-like protein
MGRGSDKLRAYALFLGKLALCSVVLGFVAFLAQRAQPNQGYVPVWPSGGLGLALLWRHGARYWPAIFISSTALSYSVISSTPLGTTVGTPLLIATGVGALQVLIVMVALLLLQRWKVHVFLADMRQFVGFGLALFAASALAIPIYSLRMDIVFQYPPLRALAFGFDYFISAAFSFLIFTPLVVAWSHKTPLSKTRRWLFAASLAALAGAGCGILSVDPALQDRLLFLLLPFVIGCALAAGVGGASAAAGTLAMILIAMARTPVAITDSILRSIFVATAALTGYLIAVMFRERERVAAEMEFHARHDALTSLMNRYEFENRVRAALLDTSRRYALLYLDLDQFKLVNDTCGHLVGDDMLRQLSGAIERALPAGAVLARLGGDEFGCLLPDATLEHAQAVARGLHDTIQAFELPVGTLRFTVGVSIGATFLAPGSDATPDDVLGRADIACYTAKERGRNRTHFYDPGDVSTQGRHAEIQTVSQLQTDLARGAFQLFAQRIENIADAADTELFYEVLLHEAGASQQGSIESILGVAQRYGLIAHVDRWVLSQAARFLGQHAGQNLRVSANIAATSLESEGFEAFVLGLPARHGFAARQFVVEITEAVAVQNLTHAVATLRRLREHGFGVSLDDFGSGVASFGYLNELPVSMVKLDGRFVRDLGTDPAAEVIIESLTRVANLRGIPCVAEWVEDRSVTPKLRRLGVTYAQGYAIHRPAPLDSIETATPALSRV